MVLAAAAATLLAVGGLAWAQVDDDTSTASRGDPPIERPSDGNTGSALTDGTHVGRVHAAYVAPNELVFTPNLGGKQVSVPVSSEVTVTKADGSAGTYGTFTLAFDEANPSSEYLGAAGSYRLTIVDGLVTAIVERA